MEYQQDVWQISTKGSEEPCQSDLTSKSIYHTNQLNPLMINK